MDLSKVYQIFFEESVDLLNEMESTLLSIHIDNIDYEKINALFRVIHTLKGNSLAVNFVEISEFLHSIETFLDSVRNKRLILSNESIQNLLKSVDLLKESISRKKETKAIDVAAIQNLEKVFVKSLDEGLRTDLIKEKNSEVTTEVAAERFEKDKMLETPAADLSLKTSIRVGSEKIDSLVNLVGELIISQSSLDRMIHQLTVDKKSKSTLEQGLEDLQANYKELQDSVLSMRMLPLSFVFARFQRSVHDLSLQLGKKVNLKILGEETQVDKLIIEKIADPLLHLIRNSIDHGIEKPEIRVSRGKTPEGHIIINAYQEAGQVVIEVEDDGNGIDNEKIIKKARTLNLIRDSNHIKEEEIIDLIFKPGFSTSEKITEISGRGVGLDVVKANIEALKGTVEIKSKFGEGTTFTLRLPLNYSIMDCQLVNVDNKKCLIPLINIVALLQVDKHKIKRENSNLNVLYSFKEIDIPLIPLKTLFWNKPTTDSDYESSYVIVIEANQKNYALLVDNLDDQQEIFIKNLEENFQKIDGLLGVTILSDGSIAPILDGAALVRRFEDKHKNNKNNFSKEGGNGVGKEASKSDGKTEIKQETIKTLSFSLQAQEYAIPILEITELMHLEQITELPFLPPYILGVTNLRGKIFPVIDLTKLLGIKEETKNNERILIVTHQKIDHKTMIFAIEPDYLGDIFEFQAEELKQDVDLKMPSLNNYILGSVKKENETFMLLDLKAIAISLNKTF